MRDVAGFKLAVQASVYVVDGCSCENGWTFLCYSIHYAM